MYISYDGMLEPLGQSQVLGYVERLAADYEIRLISFEKKADWAHKDKRQILKDRMASAGIHWIPLRYHKRPSAPATLFDIGVGTVVALYQVLRHRVAIVHARSYVAALMALIVKRLTGARFLFDMRGFWADERVDGGLWPKASTLYRATKALERRLLRGADYIVTLTEASEREIARFPFMADTPVPVAVIPTCADLARFSLPPARATEPFVLGYVGSVGTWYLLDEALLCFRKLVEREPDARLLVVNRNEQLHVRQRIEAAGIDPAVTEVLAAEHKEVPALIGRMTAGLAIIKPAYSKIASAPTKLAEYLGCGIPCLGNAGVGDVESILEGRRVGIVLRGFSPEEIEQAVDQLICLAREEDIAARCRAVAEELFSLERGVASYQAIYAALTALGKAGSR